MPYLLRLPALVPLALCLSLAVQPSLLAQATQVAPASAARLAVPGDGAYERRLVVHDELPVVLHHSARAYGEPTLSAAVARLLAARDSLAADRLHILCGAPLTGWLFHPSSAVG